MVFVLFSPGVILRGVLLSGRKWQCLHVPTFAIAWNRDTPWGSLMCLLFTWSGTALMKPRYTAKLGSQHLTRIMVTLSAWTLATARSDEAGKVQRSCRMKGGAWSGEPVLFLWLSSIASTQVMHKWVSCSSGSVTASMVMTWPSDTRKKAACVYFDEWDARSQACKGSSDRGCQSNKKWPSISLVALLWGWIESPFLSFYPVFPSCRPVTCGQLLEKTTLICTVVHPLPHMSGSWIGPRRGLCSVYACVRIATAEMEGANQVRIPEVVRNFLASATKELSSRRCSVEVEFDPPRLPASSANLLVDRQQQVTSSKSPAAKTPSASVFLAAMLEELLAPCQENRKLVTCCFCAVAQKILPKPARHPNSLSERTEDSSSAVTFKRNLPSAHSSGESQIWPTNAPTKSAHAGAHASVHESAHENCFSHC